MKIDKNEVLRYLGYKNQKISAELDQKINFLVADAKKTLKYEELYAFQKTVLERARQRKKNVETLCSK